MPGSGKQPPEIQEQIKELLEAGFDPTTIHRRLKVGRSSIYRMKRCLQQHGTNYMPAEMNKKNGRPKVLTPDQELEVKEWLRDPKNRARYLDDLVWLIHDRFGIVCSTTTMSKMKRKWLRVIQYEEDGTPIDDLTRSQLMETHPDLPLLHEGQVPQAQMTTPVHSASEAQVASTSASQQPTPDQQPTPSQPQAVAGSQQLPQPQQQFTSPSTQSFLQSPTMQMQQQMPSGSQQISPSQQTFMQSPTMQMQAQMVASAQFDPQLGFHGDFTADMSTQHLTA